MVLGAFILPEVGGIRLVSHSSALGLLFSDVIIGCNMLSRSGGLCSQGTGHMGWKSYLADVLVTADGCVVKLQRDGTLIYSIRFLGNMTHL